MTNGLGPARNFWFGLGVNSELTNFCDIGLGVNCQTVVISICFKKISICF